MKNSGVIVANDASQERLKAVVGNAHRLGMLLWQHCRVSNELLSVLLRMR